MLSFQTAKPDAHNFASQVATESILGDSSNRWYDKGNQLFCFKNGMNGNNNDVSF